MERETESMVQPNGAPMGQGQPKKGMRKNHRKPMPPEVGAALGVDPALGGQPMNGTMPTGVPQAFGGQQQPPQAPPGGANVNPQAPSGDSLAERLRLGGYQGNGNMLGFNTALDYDNDSAKGSMKNVFGQIASRYKAAPSMTQAVMNDPDFKRFFPNAKIVDHPNQDQIDFGGQIDWHSGKPVYRVDIGGAFDPANDSGAGWAWQDLVNDAAGPAPGQAIYEQAQAQVGTPGGLQMTQMLEQFDEQTLMDILKALMEQGGASDGNQPMF